MKLKKIILSFVCCMFSAVAMAEMTDQQILAYVSEQQARGTEQSEMIQYLLKQGVTPQRLQQLKQKYGSMSASGSSRNGSASTTRTRTGLTAQQPVKGQKQASSSYAVGQKTQGRLVGTAPKGGVYDTKGNDFLAMQSAFDGMFPDSTSMFMFPLEEGPKVFGRDMFRNENISFEPAMNIATPANYVLGPGDFVYIDIYGASQVSVEGEISPDGYVQVPDYGPLRLSGMTVEQASRQAKSKLGSRYAGSKIMLTVGQTRSIQVNVMGEVMVPGTYTLSAFATVFHALYSAGGVSDLGSLRNVKISRGGQEVGTVDIYDYILNGQSKTNIRLQDDDIIIVPTYEALVNISGKVKRPMFYEMLSSESVGKALDYAGGFASDAYTRNFRLVRKSGGQYQVLNLDKDKMHSVMVADGDSLSIDSIAVRFSNMIELNGAVFHPGMYQLDENTASVRKLIEYADGLSEDAFLSRAVLQRMRKDRSREVVSLNLEAILDGTAADVTLQNEDVVFIPTILDSRDNQTLTIRGDVFEPGLYAFAHNTTVEDLILQAGGLRESAAKSVTVTRREVDSEGNTKVRNISLKLNDNLAFSDNAFTLQPYDEVSVGRNPGYQDQRSVSIEGEVMLEGNFGLTQNETRISDIISQAGGLLSTAAQNGVFVLRQMNEEELRLRMNQLDKDRYTSAYYTATRASQMQTLTMLPITDSLMVERDMREDLYKVAVDIRKALKNPGCDADLVLRNGDRIVVLPVQNTVVLSGEVAHKGAVPYVEGKRLKYYLRQGGIRATRRNIRNAYVVAQNGEAQAGRRNVKVDPGSEVVLRQINQDMNTAQTVSIVVSIASTLATMAAVVISVLN